MKAMPASPVAPPRPGSGQVARPAPAGHGDDPYSAAFTAAGWAKRGPGFVREMRREAMRTWSRQGWPTTRSEAWRHTSLRDVAATTFLPADAPMRAVTEADVEPYRLPGAIEMVFVDGHAVAGLGRNARVAELPDGLRLESVATALTHPDETFETHLGRHAGDQGAVPLNTAFFADGAYVRADAGVQLEAPIHILHVATEPTRPTASHLRHLVVAGARSSLTVVETYAGLPSPSPGLTTAVTEVVAAPGSHVRRVKLQRENTHAYHIGHLAVRSDRDANVSDLLVSVGAALSRHDVDAVLGQPGAETSLDGLFLGTGVQHVDCATRIDHAVPHTTSRELYKGILDGAAHGVFLGLVQVRADAQKTNAAQTNRNLLLSREAHVDTTPQLEILADDVKCSHGSTIGALSPDALFFLQSRGIGAEAARLMLTKAFAHDVLERAPPAVRDTLDRLLVQWFACRAVAAKVAA